MFVVVTERSRRGCELEDVSVDCEDGEEETGESGDEDGEEVREVERGGEEVRCDTESEEKGEGDGGLRVRNSHIQM